MKVVSNKKTSETMEELFKNWHGKYDSDSTMKEWDKIKPTGNELW